MFVYVCYLNQTRKKLKEKRKGEVGRMKEKEEDNTNEGKRRVRKKVKRLYFNIFYNVNDVV